MMPKAVQIAPEVAAVLNRGTWEGTVYKLPAGQLERPLYATVDKVLRALGGKWDRRAGGHVFASDQREAMVAALAGGVAVDTKRSREQFFTPTDLADRMADELGIAVHGAVTHVLEPSVGSGRLAARALALGATVTAVEIDLELCEQLQADLGERYHGDLFIFPGDFLEWRPASARPIDAVLMNPPFSRNQDIAHVRHALRWLRPGGRLVAIMSPHFTFATDSASREFRELIGYRRTIVARPGEEHVCSPAGDIADATVEFLPGGTFKAEGTEIAAVLVVIDKAHA